MNNKQLGTMQTPLLLKMLQRSVPNGIEHPPKEKAMESNSGYNAGHLLLAVMSGALAGAGVAFLLAPKSGRDTRRQLSGYLGDVTNTVSRVPEALRSAGHAAQDAISHELAAGS
jgi:hypothetical protein